MVLAGRLPEAIRALGTRPPEGIRVLAKSPPQHLWEREGSKSQVLRATPLQQLEVGNIQGTQSTECRAVVSRHRLSKTR